MGTQTRLRLWLLVTLVGLPTSLGAEESHQVLATIDGRTFTEADIAAQVEPQMIRIRNQIYAAKKQALDAVIADYLLEQEAKKRGISREQLLQQEVHDKVTPVTDAEIEHVYNNNKARLGNKPLAEVKPQIAQQLQSAKLQQHQQAFVRELRKQAGVKVRLKPPAVNINLEGAPVRGSVNAPVTIVEFSDFQCPYCARVQAELAKVTEVYKDQVKIVFKDYPLTNIHPHAQKAAEAARCAGEQGKYWEYHDILFANHSTFTPDDFKHYATTLQLDATQFATCLDSGKYASAVNQDLAEGTRVGVSGTPAFFVNGRFLSGAQPFSAFQQAIEEALETQ